MSIARYQEMGRLSRRNGQQVAIWQVAEYAVGQHRGSSNPGEGSNVVLAGHVGGYGKVFKDLFYVKPGDQITLYSNGQQYLYTVQERLLLTEEGVSAEQHAANAQYIAPPDQEVVTMVTCWPPKGADRFTQRVVVRAVPFGTGFIDYDAFFTGLREGGFDGLASYEMCSPVRGGGSRKDRSRR